MSPTQGIFGRLLGYGSSLQGSYGSILAKGCPFVSDCEAMETSWKFNEAYKNNISVYTEFWDNKGVEGLRI